MKMTLLPDWEANRRNWEDRKEKRRIKRAKHIKERNRRLVKPKPIWQLLLTSALIAFLVCGSVFGVFCWKVCEGTYQSYERMFEDWGDFLQDEIQQVYRTATEKEQNEQIRQDYIQARFRFATGLSIWDHLNGKSAAIIYDIDKNQIIGGDDNRLTLYAVEQSLVQDKYGYEYYGNSHYEKCYDSLVDLSDEVLDALQKDSEYCAVIKDVYLDESGFYPGTIEYYSGDENSSELVKTENYAPKNKSELLHICFDELNEKRLEKKEKDYIDYYYICVPKIPEDMKQTAIEHLKSCVADVRLGGAGMNLEGNIGDREYYQYYRIQVEEGKDYGLVVAYRMNYIEECKAVLLKGLFVAIVLFLLMFFALFRGWYTRQIVRKEYIEFQRSLTNAMAHDLKSPLMVISGMAENLREQVHTEKRDYYAEQIQNNVEDMNRMIEQILGYSKLENQTKLLAKNKVSLDEIVDNICKQYEDTLAKKSVEIIKNGTAIITADEILMKQLVENLLHNAFLYVENNGVVRVDLNEKRFVVRNTYQGSLDTKQARKLMEAYEKPEDRKRSGGHGLGLSIVEQIVRLHGWKLKVAVEDGEFVAEVLIRG